jgi:hypothetical protein
MDVQWTIIIKIFQDLWKWQLYLHNTHKIQHAVALCILHLVSCMTGTTRIMRCVKVYRIKTKLYIMQEVVKTWESLPSMSTVVIQLSFSFPYSTLRYKYVGFLIRCGAFILTILARLTQLTWTLRHGLEHNLKTYRASWVVLLYHSRKKSRLVLCAIRSRSGFGGDVIWTMWVRLTWLIRLASVCRLTG